jgi:chemotaxis regulatin CheY-phosphate phosphatase CheZ
MRNIEEEIKAVRARIDQLNKEQRKLKPDQVEHYANRCELSDLKESMKELKQLARRN